MRIKVEVDESAVDIPTMQGMTLAKYETYIENELLFIDHHDVLRSAMGQYPLAVTREQIRALIAYLESIEIKIGGENA